ncbi:hypothetical protein [Vibrio penaeicida]|uniref:hypothetical protein n=1 Tax=Vibrio penaeicida TaxID=104609 RepID=UPI000CE9E994|nr:hypothetical protein [Vibrio penaeicida]
MENSAGSDPKSPLPLASSSAQLPSSKKIWMTLLVVAITVLGFVRVTDDKAHEMVNESMLVAGASFATARTLDAAISLVKSAEVSVGVASVTLGQVLNPVSDLIDKFAWVMTLAVGSLALQKVLLIMMSSQLANALLAFCALGLLLSIWSPIMKSYKKQWFSMFKFMVLIRFAVVISLGLNIMVDTLFLDQQIESRATYIEEVTTLVQQASDPSVLEKPTEDSSFLGSVKQEWESLTGKLRSQTERLDLIQNSVEDSIISLMELIALFLLKTVLLPLGFLIAFKNIILNKSIRVS